MSDSEQPSPEYFRLTKVMAAGRNWFLDEPRIKKDEQLDVWAFTAGHPLHYGSDLLVTIQRAGDEVDVTFSHYNIVYIQPRVGRMLEAFASWNIQRVPARLDTGAEIEILNVLTVLECFDREHSEATYEMGKPKMVAKLRIQGEKAEGHHLFRVKEWPGPLIVSGLILEHLRRMGATGFLATKVS